MPTDLDHRPNWLHLDMKGAMPDEAALCGWLDWFAAQGVNGIVFEYEDRMAWRAWPGTYRPGLDDDAWQRVHAHGRSLGLEIVPLVQTLGHLEWLLKHDAYAHLREAHYWNQLCPLAPDARDRLTHWLDEVIERHSQSRFIHLGADETWNLASCERCAAQAQRSADGAMSLYIDHVRALCAHCEARGVRPLIWADMFWRQQRADLARQLPESVILVDWQYNGPGPFQTTEALPADRLRFGGSGVRSGYEAQYALAPLQDRLDNVLGWHEQYERGRVDGLIHTNWGRGDSLRPIYGPWEGWLAGLIAAGDPARWRDHPLREHVPAVDQAMVAPEWIDTQPLAERLDALTLPDAPSARAARWWQLALAQRRLVQATLQLTVGYEGLAAVHRHIGADPTRVARYDHDRHALDQRIETWAGQVRAFWEEAGWLDVDEYLDSKAENLRRCLAHPVSISK